jgi:thiamine transporter ThiT
MKILKQPIGLFGFFYFVAGIALNINMYLEKAWPTWVFFVLMTIGLIYISLAWKTKLGTMTQILFGLLPLAGYWLLRFYWTAM